MLQHRGQQAEANGAMTRGEFLKGAALVGVGLGAVGVLPGCASGGGGTGTTVTWDREIGVLMIVGSRSVAFAALAAKDAGAESVLILERLSI